MISAGQVAHDAWNAHIWARQPEAIMGWDEITDTAQAAWEAAAAAVIETFRP